MDAGADRRSTILDDIGGEIISIVAPVSICMLLVVLLVAGLAPQSSIVSPIAAISYSESSAGSATEKFSAALLNSLVFVALVTAATFILLALFYFRCIRFLALYTAFSAFIALGPLAGEVALQLLKALNFPLDSITFVVILANFAAVGVVAIYSGKAGILVTQGYLVAIGVLVAYWFTRLPEWTTWMLLVAMAVYDLAAVLLPVGPLRLLVELAMSRNEQLPALVYEARPTVDHDNEYVITTANTNTTSINGVITTTSSIVAGSSSNAEQSDEIVVNVEEGSPLIRGGVERRENFTIIAGSESNAQQSGGNVVNVEERSPLIRGGDGRVMGRRESLTLEDIMVGSISNVQQADHVGINVEEGRVAMDVSSPLVERGAGGGSRGESLRIEGIGLGSSTGIKLGLGDFIFYSLLVGRAAMYDFMTVYACYLAIIAGLGVTLMLLGLYRKALPALPVSILLGVVFYFLTRFLLEAFVVGCSVHLLMF